MSTYNQLLRKENSLRRVEANEKFSMDAYLREIVKPRADLKKEVEEALKQGKITQTECAELIAIIQKNGLPPQKFY